MKREWRNITGYEGLYRISNYGEVYSIRSKKTLVPEILDKGYLRIGLSKNGERTRFLIHRLVMYAFDEFKPYPEWEVNHKDMDTSNNRYDNLEWTTPLENRVHAEENNPNRYDKSRINCSEVGKKYGYIGIEASKKPILRCDKHTGEILEEYESARQASLQGYNYKNISQVCKGDKKTHKGYKWRFK